MHNKNKINLYPEYLEPFLDGKPLSIELLTKCWPSISLSDRFILFELLVNDPEKSLKVSYQRTKVLNLAMDDNSVLIRYQAAQHIDEPDSQDKATYKREEILYEKLKSDKEYIVKISREAAQSFYLGNPFENAESFWSLSQIERLAIVNQLENHGEHFADIIKYACNELLPKKLVEISDINDLILQYLGGDSIKSQAEQAADHGSFFHDAWAEYSLGESINALWELTLHIPEVLSLPFINQLPEEYGLSQRIPKNVIENLSDAQLDILLSRDDIKLENLRREIYKNCSTNEDLRSAAIFSKKFKLLNSDISELVIKQDDDAEEAKHKVEELIFLAKWCRGASIVQMAAICKMIENAPDDYQPHEYWHQTRLAKLAQSRRASSLSYEELKREVFDLRIFLAAINICPFNEVPETNRAAGKDGIVIAFNPWQTYLNLRKFVTERNWRHTIEYLPEAFLVDFDIPKELSGVNDFEEEYREYDSQSIIVNLLKDVQGQVDQVSEHDKAELIALSTALSSILKKISVLESKAEAQSEVTETLMSKISSSRILMWAVLLTTFITLSKII